MTYEITFVVEGLVVFVPRRQPTGGDPKALYILLPNTQKSDHDHGESHEPHEARIRQGKKGQKESLPLDLDLLNVGLKEGGGPKIPSLVPISRNANVRVARSLLTQPLKPSGKLQARIALPLPKKAEILDADELVPVEYLDDASGKWVQLPNPVTGRIRLTYDATGTVTIPTMGTVSGPAEFIIEHLPNTPAPAPGTVIRAPAELKHLPMNDRIFGKKIPAYQTTANFTVPSMETKSLESIFGIIPVECTASLGCAEGDPDCGEG